MLAQIKFRCLTREGKEHAEDSCCNDARNHHVGGLGGGEGAQAESLAGAMSIGAAGKGNVRLWPCKGGVPSGNVLSRFLEFLHAITTSSKALAWHLAPAFRAGAFFLSASYSGASQKVGLSMPRRIKGEGRRLERNMPHPGHGESGIGFSPVRSVGDRHGKIR
jgi:hypothetical protein